MKKIVNIQGTFLIPSEYKWIARNQTGIMNGFMHPPIRDYQTGEWQDSVNGEYGFFIPFDSWETSVRKVEELTDVVEVQKRVINERQKPKKGYVDGRSIESNYAGSRKKQHSSLEDSLEDSPGNRDKRPATGQIDGQA